MGTRRDPTKSSCICSAPPESHNTQLSLEREKRGKDIPIGGDGISIPVPPFTANGDSDA